MKWIRSYRYFGWSGVKTTSPCLQPPTAISAGSDELQTPGAGAAGVGASEALEPLWGSLPRAAADPCCTSYCQLPFAAFAGCCHYTWASEFGTWLDLFLYSVVSVSSWILDLIFIVFLPLYLWLCAGYSSWKVIPGGSLPRKDFLWLLSGANTSMRLAETGLAARGSTAHSDWVLGYNPWMLELLP